MYTCITEMWNMYWSSAYNWIFCKYQICCTEHGMNVLLNFDCGSGGTDNDWENAYLLLYSSLEYMSRIVHHREQAVCPLSFCHKFFQAPDRPSKFLNILILQISHLVVCSQILRPLLSTGRWGLPNTEPTIQRDTQFKQLLTHHKTMTSIKNTEESYVYNRRGQSHDETSLFGLCATQEVFNSVYFFS